MTSRVARDVFAVARSPRATRGTSRRRARWGDATTSKTRRPQTRARRDAASSADHDALHEWLSANGADVASVEFYDARAGDEDDGGDAGWGARATRALARGAKAIVVPKSLWITPEVGMNDDELGKALRDEDVAGGLARWTTLALTLLKERERGEESKYAAYVKTLPEVLHSPLFWNAEELSEIQGTQLLDNAAGYDGYVRGVYETLRTGMFAKHADVFDVEGAFSEDNFRWAFGILRSRTMAPCDGANIALVPGVDLVNHSSLSQARWRVSGGVAGAVAGLFGGGKGDDGVSARVECDRALNVNEPLYVNYNPEGTDTSFALDFGFVDTITPSPGYALSLSVPEDDPNVFDKLDVLDACGLGETPTFTLRAYSDPDPDLRTFLRLLNCKNQDAFLLEALFRQQCWSLISEPLSRENEADCCASMTDGVAAALSAYASRALDEEKAYLMSPPSARRAAAGDDERARVRKDVAVRVRLAEKSTLIETASFFDVIASGLDGMEYYQERRLRSLNLLDEDGSSTYDPFNETMA